MFWTLHLVNYLSVSSVDFSGFLFSCSFIWNIVLSSPFVWNSYLSLPWSYVLVLECPYAVYMDPKALFMGAGSQVSPVHVFLQGTLVAVSLWWEWNWRWRDLWPEPGARASPLLRGCYTLSRVASRPMVRSRSPARLVWAGSFSLSVHSPSSQQWLHPGGRAVLEPEGPEWALQASQDTRQLLILLLWSFQ